MPRKRIQQFNVEWLQILDEEGQSDSALLPSLSPKEIQSLYEWMILSRVFDEKALALQREGRLGTYAPVRGQEATQVGSAYALGPADWVFPAFREMGVAIVRGIPMRMLFQYWSGDERGSAVPIHQHYFPTSIPVGTHLPHAVGAAWAARYRKDPVVVAVYFGDGATSKGDFHEAMNMAGVFRLPAVFICQNNQWAISVPVLRQTATPTLAQKAIAYGFEGIQVDGNDIFAVYKSAKEAVDRARSGGGPTFIECLTYRMGDHTTADDASRYRTEEMVKPWLGKDPIERLRKFMERQTLWTSSYGEQVRTESERRVAEAVREFEEQLPQDPSDMFRYTYYETTPPLKEQMDGLLNFIKDRESKEGQR
ncbi:MAG TPA: pyruvate dehydrogenase (acetyl-transferring) E1 component subunit alpha [Nitrospiria bacterium]|nr:pyruvate dehydrogenase (acetyl-transferring) E1 component subunit alpha [Nitrospiria bacterium]